MRTRAFLAAALLCAACTARAADPVISEFMADNAGYLADEDGQANDWIEIYNPGPAAVDLANWSLTDDATLPAKWAFPARTLNAGQTVVVFASGKNRRPAAGELHTNFSLNNEGEYLALVKPDGTTKTSEWNPYPFQPENVSYGTAQQNVPVSHVDNAAGRAFIPSTGNAPPAAWNTAAYAPDGAWITTTTPPGLGYDTTAVIPPASNIAPAGAASQSTTNGAFTANRATDGILTNFTHTAGGDSAPFWNVDFGANAVLHSITIRNRGDNCCGSRLRDITVQVLDAALNPVWTSALLNPENTGFTFPAGPPTLSVDLVALTGGPVTGRHVRISRTPDPDGSGAGGLPGSVDEQTVLSMGEVTVMGLAPNAQVNLARTGTPLPTATQTSQLGTFTPGLGIDGLNNNFTHTLATDTAPAWTLNLNRRSSIERIAMHNREGCCPERLRDITVQILDADGTTVLHTSALLNPGNSLGSPVDLIYDIAAVNNGNPIHGQFVRIKRTPDAAGGATDDARVLSLGEVQVRGTELNGYRPYIRSDIETAMKDKTPSAYWRLPFTVASAASINTLTLRVRYDDGFVAWINGTQVASRNAPASPGQNSTANSNRTLIEGLSAETIDLSSFIPSLATGANNVLAIHGLNFSAADDNFLLQAELSSTSLTITPNVYLSNPTPGALNDSDWYVDEVQDTVFSHRRGFYEAPFNLTITTPTADAQIYYTTNNSEPSPTNGTLYTAPIAVAGPSGPTGAAGVKVIRSRAFKANWKSTNIDTHTYIFLGDVPSQPKGSLSTGGAASGTIPPGWPAGPGTNGGQAFNFGFNPSVMAGYTPAQIREGFTQIATLSIVTQQNNLTDPLTGIYVNGVQHGEEWERPASIEMLDITKPGATPEAGHGQFGENMGLRIRGGASRDDGYTKHSFRVFFRSSYGEGKLNFRLFGAEGASEFDNFDVRSDQNYAWSNNPSDAQATMVRDPWSREALGAMGQPYTRSRFVHLYLNGLYWGMYEIHERPENSFGETYLGGDKDNYDVVKNHDRHSGVAFSTEATDGYLETYPDGSKAAWRELWERCRALPADPSNANYFRILGRNPDGSRNPAYPVLLDVDNLIDYMMAIFYTGDGDACLSGFLSFNQPNNWAGMRDRFGTRGFIFCNHDTEHTLGAPSWVGSRGRVDRFGSPDHTGPYGGSNLPSFTFSNPQWMHEDLMSNAEYRMRFADHVRRHLFNGGALTPDAAIARWNARTATITKAIVQHAGRWAASASVINNWTRLTVGPNGAGANDNIPGDFFPVRHTQLLNMLKVDGLYPAVDAPNFAQHGGAVPAGYQLNITAPAGAKIYYTLDGTDPRAIAGEQDTPFTYAAKNNANVRYRVTTGAQDGFTATQGGTAPTPGPVGRWTLSGNPADTGSGGNNGTLMASPSYVIDNPAGAGQALALNGTSQYVALGNPENLRITGQITMAAWVKPTSAPAGTANIINKGHALNPNGEVTLRMTGGAFETGTWNGENFIATASGSVTVSQWQHVAGVFDGTAWRLYKNGEQISALETTQGAVDVAGSAVNNNAWAIGARGGGGERYFPGRISSAALYNRSLSAAEVRALYQSEAGTLYTPDWAAPAWPVPAEWGTGSGGFGYDTNATVSYTPFIVTDVLAAMQGKSTSLLTRNAFTLTADQLANTGYLQLNVRYDDGFIAYLNGKKIAERSAPPLNPNGASAATALRTDTAAVLPEKINVTANLADLAAGNNVLAIQGLNRSLGDNDMLLEAELVAGDADPGINPQAQLYTGAIPLTGSATVKARIYHNGTWSAVTEAFFAVATVPAGPSNLVISEIHYHPENPVTEAELAVTGDKDEYEFIEVMNIDPASRVDLTGVRFMAGITTDPAAAQVLAPGESAVYVKNAAAFQARYGSLSPAPRVLGTYGGSLSNQGEPILLNAANGTAIRDFAYDDNAPWPVAADGEGPSLVLVNPLANPDHSLPASWTASGTRGGSPGSAGTTGPSGYASWKTANGVTSDTDDSDRDGLPAFLEYALNTSPAAADTNPPAAGTDAGFLTFTLTYRDAPDIRVTPEVSTALSSWSSQGITILATSANPGGTVTTVWKAPASMASQGHLFFRAKVELQ